MNPSIFVSIAAYREFDLENTVLNAIQNAEDARRLRFVICWQHDANESIEQIATLEQVEIIDVPCEESRGVCWARHQIQQRYEGEAFALQLDSHHRFVTGWDSILVAMLESLEAEGVEKPVLTTYLPGFDPDDDPAARCMEAWQLGFDYFDSSGIVLLSPYTSSASLDKPAATAFWSAHFSFSRGGFVSEVPIDPHGYFHGEEISTAVRGWTHGYDFFCPHRLIAWHEYTRRGRVCHWHDHKDWSIRNGHAIGRFNALLGVDGMESEVDYEDYGLGSHRSVAEYERFAGIDFSSRRVRRNTLEQCPPKNTENGQSESQEYLYSFTQHVEIPMDMLRDDGIQFVGLFANAKEGAELHRREIDRKEMDTVVAEAGSAAHFSFLMKLFALEAPRTYTIWPYYRAAGWGDAISKPWELAGIKGKPE